MPWPFRETSSCTWKKSDLEYHVSEISRILKSDGKSIIAFLNPSYEQKKHLDLSPHNKPLQTNEKYSFVHGSHGEHGVFAHYWKDIDTYEKIFDKHLKIINRVECFPITDRFREKNTTVIIRRTYQWPWYTFWRSGKAPTMNRSCRPAANPRDTLQAIPS
ncbi:hypothetical protein ACFS3C_05885 [Azotobacter vinelandii]